jgi:transcriptional regulator with PAS, ATPase and Fis domain
VNVYKVKFNKPHLTISNEVFDALMNYDFPGNVRELINMTERAIILSKGNILGIADFRIKSSKSEISTTKDDLVNLRAQEIKMIKKALLSSKYNQQTAADLLGITRDALTRKMKKYDISITKGEA